MAKNGIKDGKVLTVTAPVGGLESGQGYLFGDIFGVVLVDAAEAYDTEMQVDGCWSLSKVTGAIIAGQKLYWDNTQKKLTTTATGNKFVGNAIEAAATNDATAKVRLSATVEANLKTFVKAHTVTAGEATANQADIDTGFAAAPEVFQVQILRSGVDVKADAVVTALGGGDLGKIRVADGAATYSITAGDVIHLVAYKA